MHPIHGMHGYCDLFREFAASTQSATRLQVVGSTEAFGQFALLAAVRELAVIERSTRKILVVVPTAKDMSPWLSFLDANLPGLNIVTRGAKGRQNKIDHIVCAGMLPYFSLWGHDRFINPNLSRRQRLYSLGLLADSTRPAVVVTTMAGMFAATLRKVDLTRYTKTIIIDATIDWDELINFLMTKGYHEESVVEEEGQYAVRGGIIDVFAPNNQLPIRIELQGDKIVSLRWFDASDQRSLQSVDEVKIGPSFEALTPASERPEQLQTLYSALLDSHVDKSEREGIVSAFERGLRPPGFTLFEPLFRDNGCAAEYLGEGDFVWFAHPLAKSRETYVKIRADMEHEYLSDRDACRATLAPDRHFIVPPASEIIPGKARIVEFGNPFAEPGAKLARISGRVTLEDAPVPVASQNNLFDRWATRITDFARREQGEILLLGQSEDHLERIATLFVHRGLTVDRSTSSWHGLFEEQRKAGRILLARGELSGHIWFDDTNLLVITDHALFGGERRRQKPASAKLQNYLSSFRDLRQGDLIVHVQHGVGAYRGITTLDVGGVHSDFLLLEYADGDKIYLPVDRLNLLQRYSSGVDVDGKAPLDKLGGGVWEKRKSRVRGAVKDMAEELLKIQAGRQISERVPYSAPSDTYFQFEEEFPYQLTDDQQRAIAEVNADLQSRKPVDRLICGDVGFGKTEVALRAAFRCALDGQQVLVLVPTTVLCYQHYRTFQTRLSRYGIKIAQANRFVDGAEIKDAISGLEAGRIDILIGTHRILSKDIKPRRLGLLIIDEEQRFGVSHKEKLKKLKADADVITLTATPIPRTLHMAMMGLRDISMIATPPQDRLAVKTYIAKFDETLVRDAIEHEVNRGGQVFFVHNRVQDIEEIRNYLKSLLPKIDMRVAHGQMVEGKLETVIVDFLEQRFPVLVCTTIIESGIDMPNVNTLIVNNSHCFGLAQMYQLRGRVGRSNQQAYAYFLTPGEERLTDDAKKRLEVLSAHQELGAGFQIASYDLELRGAGNLLGAEQSGHVSEVGLELYTQMLEDAISEIRGQQRESRIDTEIKLPISATISKEFIASENQRLQVYKQLFSVAGHDELGAVQSDVTDRFGELPADMRRLFKIASLKIDLRTIRAVFLGVSERGFFEIKFADLSDDQVNVMLGAVSGKPEQYQLVPGNKLYMRSRLLNNRRDLDQDALLDELRGMISPLALLFEKLSHGVPT